MNEAMAGSRLLHCTKDGRECQQQASVDNEGSNDIHQPLSSRSVQASESTTTRSLSDGSGNNPMIVVDHRHRNHASGMKWPFKKSTGSPSPASSKDSSNDLHGSNLKRHSTGRRKIGRKLLAGMIAKVMMGTIGDHHSLDGTEKEISGESDPMFKIEESKCKGVQKQGGVVLPTSPPFFENDDVNSRDNKKMASQIRPTNLCTTSSASYDGSVITEEVIFEEELPLAPVFDYQDEVASTGSKKKSLIRASSDTTGDDTMGDASVKRHLPQRSASSRDLHFSLEAQRDLVPRLPPRQQSFEKLVSPVRDEKLERPGEILVAPLSDAFCPARRNTTHSTSTRSSCTSSGGTILSGEQIHAYVMSHMPDFVQRQLPEDEWRRIFSAAAAVQESPLAFAVTVSGSIDNGKEAAQIKDEQSKEGRLTDDDVSSVVSVVSGLSMPYSVGEFKEESVCLPRRSSDSVASQGASTTSKRSVGRARSWHEGSSTHESAPRLPRRFGQKVEPETQLLKEPAFPKHTMALEPSSFRNAPPKTAKPKRTQRVVFAKVYVRYYERILDVNPSTRSGPSVGLGWNYKDMGPIELARVKEKTTEYHSLVLARPEREKMLYDLGYSRGDLAKAVRLNLKLKNQRAQTYNNLRHEKVEYLVEKSKRKVGQLLRSFSGAKKD